MSADKEKIIEKIKKLLKLEKNTNFEGEAENAMAAAMKLAAGIGLSVDEIKFEEEDDQNIQMHDVYKEKQRYEIWERKLACGIADALGCILLIGTLPPQTMNLIGTKGDSVLFQWLFPYVVKQLRALCRRDYRMARCIYPSERAFQRSWYSGASYRVIKRARAIFRNQSTPDERAQYALVVADKRNRCQSFIDNSGMNVKDASDRRRKELDQLAMTMGINAAAEVAMGRPVESANDLLIPQ